MLGKMIEEYMDSNKSSFRKTKSKEYFEPAGDGLSYSAKHDQTEVVMD